MAEKVFDGFSASFDVVFPSAQQLALVCKSDSFEPFDSVVDPRHADLLADRSSPDRPLGIDDPTTVEHCPENPEIVSGRLLPGMG